MDGGFGTNARRSVIKSVQYGTVVIGAGATSATATISSVTTSKSVVVFLGFQESSSAATPQTYLAYLTLTNATTVTATRQASGDTLTVGFCVVEFQ